MSRYMLCLAFLLVVVVRPVFGQNVVHDHRPSSTWTGGSPGFGFDKPHKKGYQREAV